MRRCELFGWRGHVDLRTAARLVTQATGVALELHDSMYRGGDYFRSPNLTGDNIRVQSNFEDEEGYLAEPDFPDQCTLLYMNGGDDDLARALASIDGVERLRSRVL